MDLDQNRAEAWGFRCRRLSRQVNPSQNNAVDASAVHSIFWNPGYSKITEVIISASSMLESQCAGSCYLRHELNYSIDAAELDRSISLTKQERGFVELFLRNCYEVLDEPLILAPEDRTRLRISAFGQAHASIQQLLLGLGLIAFSLFYSLAFSLEEKFKVAIVIVVFAVGLFTTLYSIPFVGSYRSLVTEVIHSGGLYAFGFSLTIAALLVVFAAPWSAAVFFVCAGATFLLEDYGYALRAKARTRLEKTIIAAGSIALILTLVEVVKVIWLRMAQSSFTSI